MSLAAIKRQLNQEWETNIYRIGLVGDSIWYPIGSVVETDGSHPYCGLIKNCFGRMLYDYLNFNKPTFRSIEHASWTLSGGSSEYCNYEGLGTTDKVRIIAVGNYATIGITGNTTVVFWFEGGYTGHAIDTGEAKITVSIDGGAFVDISTTSIKGRKTPVKVGQTIVYETPINTIDTNITYLKSAILPATDSTSHIEVQYNDLDITKTYTFKIEALDATVRIGGCFYFSGKTAVVQYIANPGSSWVGLATNVYQRITINNFQLAIVNSLIYHDFDTSADIVKNTKNFIRQLKKDANLNVIMVSCTPMGVQIVDSNAVLGDELPSYFKGENCMREFNHHIAFYITQPTFANYPQRDSVYSIVVGGTTYELRCMLGKPLEATFPTWTYRTVLMFEYPEGFPASSVTSYPYTITKVSGNVGANTFTLNSLKPLCPPFEEHILLMKQVATYFRLQFVDVYKVFADLAIANGETVETDGYDVQVSSPLYDSYPTGKENYLSRYFRPNHWDLSANQPVFESIRDEVFIKFQFK